MHFYFHCLCIEKCIEKGSDPYSPNHLGLGGAPTIFWGSREPGAGCPCPTGMASAP